MKTLEELLALLQDKSKLSVEDLTQLESDLRERYTDIKDKEIDEAAVKSLEKIVTAIEKIRDEQTARETAQAETAAKLADLDTRMVDEADEADEDATEEVADAPAEEADGEDEATEEADAEAVAEVVAEAEQITADAPAAVTASAKPKPLSTVASKQTSRSKPKATPAGEVPIKVFAGTDIPGVPAGSQLHTKEEMAEALIKRFSAFRGAQQGVSENITVITAKSEMPIERRLSSQNGAFANSKIIDGEVGLDALVASGGICAPTTPLYEQVMLSQAERPVKSALKSFNADRGGIRWIASPTLADVGTTAGAAGTQAIDQITEAEDAANATKPYQEVDCGEELEVQIYAVTKILQFGNSMQRTFPELVKTWVDLTLAAHARYAETLLITGIAAGSTAVNTAQDFGAARDLLNYVNLAATAYKNRHRMPVNAVLDVLMPHWVVALYQNDVWSAAYPPNGENDVTEETIKAKFRARNINISFFYDGVSGQIFGTQAAGTLNPFPTVVRWYMFHSGCWLFLDGGTLDLGVVRDSTLNATNDFRMFAETFEQVAKVGIESLAVRSTICANGAAAGTIDPDDVCDGGS